RCLRGRFSRGRGSLSPRYIPAFLPHRQNYLGMLRNLFSDFLERPKEIYQKVVQLYGPTGSGKSRAAKNSSQKLKRPFQLSGTERCFFRA
ncbi:hypothetical protein KEJ48_06835, partial [Candidatus Bathyarchaeota archaeon]|nr:hypothetical protein [Candidatus Bathyarchaeota archaeon]